MAVSTSPAKKPPANNDPPRATRMFVNRDVDGSTSTELSRLLVARGLKVLPPDAPATVLQAASLFLAGPRDTIPWAQLEEGPLTLVNKIRGHELITRKSKLARLLRGYAAHPQTFILTPLALRSSDSPGLSQLQKDKRRALELDDEKERAALLEAEAGSPSCWIVKDAQGAKGDNIAVCEDAMAAIAEAESGRHATAVVVQRYVREPMLLPGGRKFDMRLWVLFDAEYRVFVHRRGVCRTSSSRYDPQALGDKLAHVTNHCVQATGADFERFEPGNELFFEDFDRVLREAAGISLGEHVWPQLTRIVKHVAAAARETLAPATAAAPKPEGAAAPGARGGRQGASAARPREAEAVPLDERGVLGWQLFGFDFLLDAGRRLHLLEVNGSPAIADALRARITADLASLLIARLGGRTDVEAAQRVAGEFTLVYSPPT